MKTKALMAGVFGGTAMVLVLIKCIFSHVAFGSILLQMLIGGILFAGFGFGIAFVLESQVPQIWNLIEKKKSFEEEEDEVKQNADDAVSAEENSKNSLITNDAEEVEPLPLEKAESDKPVNSSYVSPARSKRVERVGNSLIIGDKQFPDNPEQLAKAIKTKLQEE